MSEAALKKINDERFSLTGELDFDTVPQLLAEGDMIFSNAASRLTVDLSGVTRTTSVGVALVIEWLRKARSVQKTILFENVPAQMLAMAKLSGLEDILSLTPTSQAPLAQAGVP